jgi:AbrB family looped-hinge helix DNA binding protein
MFLEKMVRQNVMVSGRGQITLPVKIRKRLGIQSGGIVIVEDRDKEVILRPAAVVEVETYSDADIARWDNEDRLEPSERKVILKRLDRM